MSLIRIAIRIAAVEALKGRTLVGDNVLDSEIGVIDINTDGDIDINKKRPFIAVYTDVALVNVLDTDLRSLTKNGNIDLVFETGVTSAMVETLPDGDAALIGAGFPDTDRAMERSLDLVVRQIFDALADPVNEWAKIFRSLTTRFTELRRSRVSTDSGGLRRAAQQINLKVDLVADPITGEPLKVGSPFSVFLTKIESDTRPEYKDLVGLIRKQLGNNQESAEVNQRRYGYTFEEGQAMLLPVPGEAVP